MCHFGPFSARNTFEDLKCLKRHTNNYLDLEIFRKIDLCVYRFLVLKILVVLRLLGNMKYTCINMGKVTIITSS